MLTEHEAEFRWTQWSDRLPSEWKRGRFTRSLLVIFFSIFLTALETVPCDERVMRFLKAGNYHFRAQLSQCQACGLVSHTTLVRYHTYRNAPDAPAPSTVSFSHCHLRTPSVSVSMPTPLVFHIPAQKPVPAVNSLRLGVSIAWSASINRLLIGSMDDDSLWQRRSRQVLRRVIQLARMVLSDGHGADDDDGNDVPPERSAPTLMSEWGCKDDITTTSSA